MAASHVPTLTVLFCHYVQLMGLKNVRNGSGATLLIQNKQRQAHGWTGSSAEQRNQKWDGRTHFRRGKCLFSLSKPVLKDTVSMWEVVMSPHFLIGWLVFCSFDKDFIPLYRTTNVVQFCEWNYWVLLLVVNVYQGFALEDAMSLAVTGGIEFSSCGGTSIWSPGPRVITSTSSWIRFASQNLLLLFIGFFRTVQLQVLWC